MITVTPGWTPLLKISLFSLWRQILQKIDKVLSANLAYIFWKNNPWARFSATFHMGLTIDFKSYISASELTAILLKQVRAEWGKKYFFFVGQTKKIECNFTTKFIGFIKYTAMKTILLARLTCNIFVANHSQPGTSLRSQKLWCICVKHVINSGVQPPVTHEPPKILLMIRA